MLKRLSLSAALLAAMLAGAAWAQSPSVDGEVRKIDKAQQKITLKHGAIANIQMPPMTMVFHIKDAAALDKLQVGDKVKFSADKVDGQFTVTEIQKVQ